MKRVCFSCNKTSRRTMLCAGCNFARYCDATCQKNHWCAHKPACMSMKKTNTERVSLLPIFVSIPCVANNLIFMADHALSTAPTDNLVTFDFIQHDNRYKLVTFKASGNDGSVKKDTMKLVMRIGTEETSKQFHMYNIFVRRTWSDAEREDRKHLIKSFNAEDFGDVDIPSLTKMSKLFTACKHAMSYHDTTPYSYLLAALQLLERAASAMFQRFSGESVPVCVEALEQIQQSLRKITQAYDASEVDNFRTNVMFLIMMFDTDAFVGYMKK